jgi:hypothetical protein
VIIHREREYGYVADGVIGLAVILAAGLGLLAFAVFSLMAPFQRP